MACKPGVYPDHLEGPVVAGTRERYVCADCRDVVSELRRARPDLDGTMLTLEDVRDCLGEIRDNEKTEIDLVLAAERVEANRDLERAEWEFTIHRDVALQLWKVWKCFGPDAIAEAREALTTALRAEGLVPEALPGGLRWLLLQGKAFASEGWAGHLVRGVIPSLRGSHSTRKKRPDRDTLSADHSSGTGWLLVPG